MNDVFISYEHESKSIADNICAVLEQKKIRCWYAPRDVIGDYATSIVDAISKCKIFVLVLNENSSNSQHCLNEVEIAYKANIETQKNITIMPFRVDNRNLSMAMEYYVKRLHWIDAANRSLEVAIQDLMEKIETILKPSAIRTTENERRENKYFSAADLKEKSRLAIQRKLLKNFDQEVYDNAVWGKSSLNVLDLGCNDGSLIIDRLGDKIEVAKIIGVEFDNQTVLNANIAFANTKFRAHQCDVEADDFASNISEIMEQNNIKAFDLVNISMLFLHLKKPYRLIKTLRKFMNKDSTIIIRDIDDGLNFAYPDESGNFDRIYAICSSNETAGYRKSGRQIYSYMLAGGLKDIKLEKAGLNSIGMNYDERQALFDTYFSFILEDLNIMVNRYPDDTRIKEDYEWYSDIYDEIEEKFHSDNFIFNLGFMLFTAKK